MVVEGIDMFLCRSRVGACCQSTLNFTREGGAEAHPKLSIHDGVGHRYFFFVSVLSVAGLR